MTGPLYRLGRACSRHHRLVIALWVVAVIALAAVGRAAGEQTSDNLSLPGTDSTQATDRLEDDLPDQAYGTNPIVLKAGSGNLTDSKNADGVDAAVKSLDKQDHVIKAVNPVTGGGGALLSKDKTIGYIPVTLDIGPADLSKEEAQEIIDAAKPASDARMEVEAGGYLGQAVSKPETRSSEVVGLTAAVIILLFAFGSATAMMLPIISAVLGLISALAIIGLLGHLVEVPSVAPTLATMIGLGVGIDYALFIVTRHKLQLKDGMEMEESVARAAATAGGAVAFAGMTVMIALCSLAFAGIPLVTTMGYTAAVAVVVAVIAAVTLLPAMLGALGPRIDSLRVHIGGTHPDDQEAHGWRRFAAGVAKRPWRSMIAATLVLVVLAVPARNLELGQNDVGALSEDTTARKAYDLISEGFGPGQNGPLLVATKLGTPAKNDQKSLDDLNKQAQEQQQKEQQAEAEGQPAKPPNKSDQQKQADQKKFFESKASDPRLQTLKSDIAKTKGVKSVSEPVLDKQGTTAILTAIPTTAPSDEATEDLVNTLREDVIPKAVKGTDLDVSIGGQTAGYIDLAEKIGDKLPSMILIVVGLSFIVLMLAFRSILLPLKAAVCNLLSVGAAYGVVTFVFQEGHGAELLGLDGPVPIVSFAPLLMFAILFGLSMDYEVFLLTQIQEHWKEEGKPTKAVIDGLAATGRVITSAALIMVCVFTSFILNGDPTVKEFGVGLAVAIAIDATLVRCLLVPAIMVVMGRSAWWLPRWLGRALPKVSIEGEDYFKDRPAPQT